ncbi:MAG: hypothetical protein ACRBN8_34575 [Nannocystales bacterium]
MERVLVVMSLVVGSGCVLNPAFDPIETDGGTGAAETEADAPGSSGEPPGDVPGCGALGPVPADARVVGPDEAPVLANILSEVTPGQTIALEPGRYPLESILNLEVDGVTLRSTTGEAADVVLAPAATLIAGLVINASEVTVAELTFEGGGGSQLVVSGSTRPADDVVAYRLRFLDPVGSAIRTNTGLEGTSADRGLLACSELRFTDAARDARAEDCSAGGISGFGVWDWTVRDNLFEGFWCPSGYAGVAVAFSEGSARTLVERNVIRESVQGVVLGLNETFEPKRPTPACGSGVYFDHVGGVVRNNAIVSVSEGMAASQFGLDTGLGLWNVCDTKAVHNTVLTAVPAFSSIEYRFPNTRATVANNLVTHPIFDRDDAGVPSAGNLEVDLSVFVSPLEGDFHLRAGSAAVDAGAQLGAEAVTHDIDGDVRDEAPDVGADEL